MKFLSTVALTLLFCHSIFAAPTDYNRELAETVKTLDSKSMENLATQNHGRIKPLHSLARESVLFIAGKYSMFGLDSIELYTGLILSKSGKRAKLINIRNKTVREQLGFTRDQRHVSMFDLEASPLEELSKPLYQKQKLNPRSLEPSEKDLLEVSSQYWLSKQIQSGNHFFEAIDFSFITERNHGSGSKVSEVMRSASRYLSLLAENESLEAAFQLKKLKEQVRNQAMPELFQKQLSYVNLEVFYNKSKLFFLAALLMLLLGIALLLKPTAAILTKKPYSFIMAVPFTLLLAGFTIRVIITGFAPVTNMYGTMIWVAFGISLFSLILLFLYKNRVVVSALWITSSFFLLLTESLPLILSPDMDPVVAVLRNNLWLTIHVLTIVISYAAFSINMALGNIVLVRGIITKKFSDQLTREYAHYMYRMTQLGVFLLSVGIILGGVWADYSWGRFWGWDPKETWSLIANLGYLAILHARYAGWLTPFLAAVTSTLAYLLVIMAWYGVNFILASGLHSYGFSSGGTTVVLTFTAMQVLLVLISTGVFYFNNRKTN